MPYDTLFFIFFINTTQYSSDIVFIILPFNDVLVLFIYFFNLTLKGPPNNFEMTNYTVRSDIRY